MDIQYKQMNRALLLSWYVLDGVAPATIPISVCKLPGFGIFPSLH